MRRISLLQITKQISNGRNKRSITGNPPKHLVNHCAKQNHYYRRHLQHPQARLQRICRRPCELYTPAARCRPSFLPGDKNRLETQTCIDTNIKAKEHFSKLRLSYVEQVTKEKFLRALIADPPQFVESHENAELEAQILEAKQELKARKANVKEMMDNLETQGCELSRRMLATMQLELNPQS